MEKIKSKGFTAKDEFNAAAAEGLKNAKNNIIEVKDLMIKENIEGKAVAYLKTSDDTLYATISSTVIEQSLALFDMLPAKILVKGQASKDGNEYLTLELQ